MHFVEHVVSSIDETGIQRCVLCGEIIEDYSNVSVAWVGDEKPTLGWPEGSVFITGKSPRITQTFVDENDTSETCLKS